MKKAIARAMSRRTGMPSLSEEGSSSYKWNMTLLV